MNARLRAFSGQHPLGMTLKHVEGIVTPVAGSPDCQLQGGGFICYTIVPRPTFADTEPMTQGRITEETIALAGAWVLGNPF